jgi:hypothetical protein
MRTDARFIGKDGSCDLKRMNVYRIEIIENKPTSRYRFTVFVNGLGIPYDTMKGIKKNWLFPLYK